MRAEIDEAGHQHDARGDVGRAAHDAARHGAKAGLAESRRVPAGELGRHLVPPDRIAGPALDHRHVVEAEGEQHRLLQPLMDGPALGPVFSATRSSPRSSRSSAASTASRTSPLVSKPIRSRSANAASITRARLSCCMTLPFERALRYPSGSEGVNNGRLPPRVLALSSPAIVTVTGPHRSCRSISDALPDGFLDRCAAIVGARAGAARSRGDRAPYEVDFWRHIDGRGRSRACGRARPRRSRRSWRWRPAAGVAIVPQGGNTGLVGGGIPDHSGRQVVLSLAGLDRIRAVDPRGEWLVAEAGCTLAAVQAAAEAAGRLFPLSLGSEGTCQIGGNLSSNAGGVNVIRYGMARELVLGLEVVLADGRVWNGLRTLRKDNTGYDLKQVFLGAEGSLGIITAASLRLFARPRERVTAVRGRAVAGGGGLAAGPRQGPLRRADLQLRADGRRLRRCGGRRICRACATRWRSQAPWYVLAELAWSLPDGLAAAAEAWLADAFEAGLVLDATLAASEAQRAMLWRMREELSPAMRQEGQIVRNDISVPVGRIPELIERGVPLIAGLVPDGRLLPFGHVGDGNLHFNILLPQDDGRTRARCASASTMRSATWCRSWAARSAPSTASAGSRPRSWRRARARSSSS